MVDYYRGGMKMLSTTSRVYYFGMFASISTMILWIVLHFFNPYNNQPPETDVLFNTFFTLLVPAFIAFFGALKKKTILLFIAFIWSLPISLYMSMTPGIFKLFGLTSILYLLTAILMLISKLRKNKSV